MDNDTTTTSDIETPKAKSTQVDIASLKPADRKVLVRLFGEIPTSGAIRVQVAKRSSTGVCLCGCGGETKSEFKAGHDAQMKSLLRSLVAGAESNQINHRQFTKATAQTFLTARGW